MAINIGGGLALPAAESNVLQTFSDATAGRSLILYWGVCMRTSAATSYALSRDAGTSDPVQTNGNQDRDIDVTINKSTIFQGIGYVDLKMDVTAAGDGTTHISAQLYHYDGSTETSLTGLVTSQNKGGGSYNLKLPLTVTKKHFKPGDILRLNIILTQGGGGAVAHFHHDPLTAGDELKLWVPVVNLE